MIDPNFRFTPEERAAMKAQMMAALRPKPKPQPPTATQKAEARFAAKPTEAIAQDVERSSDALTARLLEERLSGRRFTVQEIANRQAILDRGYIATRRLQEEIVRVPYHTRSATVGRFDSDAGLHVSPEDQVWK